jgi:signal transduction histidine kinase
MFRLDIQVILDKTATTTILKVNAMSIRKRLFISNAAMVLMPFVMFILYFLLLNVLFSGDIKNLSNNYHRGWQTPQIGNDVQMFNRLKKTASLQSEKFMDTAYLDSLTKNMKKENTGIIIRKGKRILYKSSYVKNLINGKLPKFGQEGYDPVVWLGHKQYSIRQHDFYYKDGTEGSVFYVDEGVHFIQFARKYFPLIFFGLVLILVMTNILLSFFMSRSILRPVKQLSIAAGKISEGDLDYQVESSSKDELGRLVKTFDDMRARLKESSKLREQYESNRKELIANISHDLKTPITSIRGYVEGIKDGVANTEDKLERYLDTIHAKAEHMDHLIDELSLYSKLDVKSLPFHFEKVEVKAFMEDYLEELRLEYKEDVEISLQATNPLTAILDRDKLIRVMNNIVRNSVKYMDKEVCKITIAFQEDGEMVKVSISDNGPGVPSNEISHIFNRFYRTDPSRNSHTGGSGLGLAISAQIIEAHGGSIWAESSPREGLCTYFTLKKPENKGDDH